MSDVVQYKGSTTADILLSDAAKKHILFSLNKEAQYKGIRFSVKKTGCSGLSYVVDYVQAIHADDLVQPLDASFNLYIDKKSYPYLKGLHVDYVKSGLNQKFVFNNPNQTGQCGCGESFTVE